MNETIIKGRCVMKVENYKIIKSEDKNLKACDFNMSSVVSALLSVRFTVHVSWVLV